LAGDGEASYDPILMSVPRRLVWAVDVLDIRPNDQVLEIGCGHGAAVDLICRKLVTGKLTAIDRSAKMIEVAKARNARHVEAGRAAFRTASLDALGTEGEDFDTIFAVNVNVFWVGPASTELEVVDRLLKPGGALYLFYEPPDPAKLPELAETLMSVLTRHGFVPSIERAESLLCVVARRSTDQAPAGSTTA
jgi:ubiquinone/menaquinone biosynthesis C-methylase UbiE